MSALILAITLIAMEMEMWPLAPPLITGGTFIILIVLAIANDVASLIDKIFRLR